MVVGSDDGKVRLYSSATLTQAKTSIPGLGAPVTAVDVSYDAEWVLATTDRYLMVVKTRFTDKAGRWAAQPQRTPPPPPPSPACMRLPAPLKRSCVHVRWCKGP